MKTKADVLSVKEEKFCQLMAAGTCKDQSDAYRKAFKPKTKTKAASIHVLASKVMAKGKIRLRISELMAPVIAKVQMTREEWLLECEQIMRGDVRKLFNEYGQPVEVSKLGDNEAAIIEGLEVVENFAKVGDHAEHVGYTTKIKLTPKLKRALEFGKVMGWYTEKKELGLDATLEELVLGSMNESSNR